MTTIVLASDNATFFYVFLCKFFIEDNTLVCPKLDHIFF